VTIIANYHEQLVVHHAFAPTYTHMCTNADFPVKMLKFSNQKKCSKHKLTAYGEFTINGGFECFMVPAEQFSV